MKRYKKKLKSELPDCVISYIFSKLPLKDLVKTSTLSKQWIHEWIHEWGSKTDLEFDLRTMFDYNTISELPKRLPIFQRFLFQSQFATRLDQLMLHYQGVMINSIRVDFPLGNEHSDVIDRLISKGIAKGVKRIELLFGYEPNDASDFISPYNFSLTFLSDNDSLTYLHLQNCGLVIPMKLSGFNHLRTLVLHLVHVEQDVVQAMCSNFVHLVDFTLDRCQFNSNLKIDIPTLLCLKIVNGWFYAERSIDIIAPNLLSFEYSCNWDFQVYPIYLNNAHMISKFSYRDAHFYKLIGFNELKNITTIVLDGVTENLSTHVWPYLFSECLLLEDATFKNCLLVSSIDIISPKLRHLNIINCACGKYLPSSIAIDALNLSSFGYSGHTKIVFLTTPRLLKVFWNAIVREEKPHPFSPIHRLLHIENLAMTITPSQIQKLTKMLVRLKNIRQLKLFIKGACDPNMDYFWLLDVIMASQHLQKLSLTIKNLHPKHSHMVRLTRQKREYVEFSQNDLKYVEFHGCVCSINVIELASHLLKKANLLEKMAFSSCDQFYIDDGEWTTNSNDCCWFGHNVIQEMLKHEVNEHCQLLVL